MKCQNKRKKRVLFVCSAGGHLAQILEMKALFNKFDYLLVAENIEATRPLKESYNIQFAYPAGKGHNLRFWKNFILNHFFAFKVILKFKPDVIITTGSHTAIPFCYIGKFFKKKIFFTVSGKNLCIDVIEGDKNLPLGWYSPSYDLLESTKVFRIQSKTKEKCIIKTKIKIIN